MRSGRVRIGIIASRSEKIRTEWQLLASVFATASGEMSVEQVESAKDFSELAKKEAEKAEASADQAAESAISASSSAAAAEKSAMEAASQLSRVYKFRGTVATEADLPVENNALGDVWNVADTGQNFAWDGENWDALAGDSFATKEELAEESERAKDAEASKVPLLETVPAAAFDNANGYGYLGTLRDLGAFGGSVLVFRLYVFTRSRQALPNGSVAVRARILKIIDGAWVVAAQSSNSAKWNDYGLDAEIPFEMQAVPGVTPPSADETVAIVFVSDSDAPAGASDGALGFRAVSVRGGIVNALNAPDNLNAVNSWSPRMKLRFAPLAGVKKEATADEVEVLSVSVAGLPTHEDVVHRDGDESINGVKSFAGTQTRVNKLLAFAGVDVGAGFGDGYISVLPMGTTVLGANAYGLHVSATGGLQLFGTHFLRGDIWTGNSLKIVANNFSLYSTGEAAIGFDFANKVVFRTMPNDGTEATYELQAWQWDNDSHSSKSPSAGVKLLKPSQKTDLVPGSVLNMQEGDARWGAAKNPVWVVDYGTPIHVEFCVESTGADFGIHWDNDGGNYNLYLPEKSGTIALLSDIPDVGRLVQCNDTPVSFQRYDNDDCIALSGAYPTAYLALPIVPGEKKTLATTDDVSAADASAVHKTGAETISGVKSFSDGIRVKNIESLVGAPIYDTTDARGFNFRNIYTLSGYTANHAGKVWFTQEDNATNWIDVSELREGGVAIAEKYRLVHSGIETATALGRGASALADGAVALGDGAVVSEPSAIAIGEDASCASGYSVAVGDGASASGIVSCIVIGAFSSATGAESAVVGSQSSATGRSSVILGNHASLGIDFAVAVSADNPDAGTHLEVISVAGASPEESHFVFRHVGETVSGVKISAAKFFELIKQFGGEDYGEA